ncbi:MAG TPA: hypothetical protein VM123_16380 [archaeon]|nr:hypothetical protein [archaeon]
MTRIAEVAQDKLKLNKHFKLVHILWLDSRGASPNWQYIDDDEPQLIKCHTVGYLVHEGKDAKRIAPHIIEDEDGDVQVTGDMVIPNVAILKMKTIE